MLTKFRQSKFFGPFFIILAGVIWAIGSVIRVDVQDFTAPNTYNSPIQLVFWENFSGFIVLLPFLLFKYKEILKLNKNQLLVGGLIGLIASSLGTVFFVAGLSLVFFVPLSIVVLMQQLQPIWAIISARLFLKEKLPYNFLGLACLAIFGAF